MGLRSQHAVSCAAHIASLALAAPDILRICQRHGGATPQLNGAIADCYSRLTAAGYFDATRRAPPPVDKGEQPLPATCAEFIPHFAETSAAGLQGVVSAAIDGVAMVTWRAAAVAESDEEAVRVASLTGPGSGAFMSAVPTERALTLPDAAFRHAVRLRLGLPPCDRMPQRCPAARRFLAMRGTSSPAPPPAAAPSPGATTALSTRLRRWRRRRGRG